jgi:hypothetical protein
MVIVSEPAFVVIEIPVPASRVSVSVLESDITLDWPATAIVAKLLDAVPPLAVELMVILSVAASVVMVMFVPATRVSVSVAESAATLLCPATAMVLKLSDAAAPTLTVAHVLSPRRYVVLSLVPDAPSLSTGTVPDVNCVAFSAVRFTPELAGNVAGNRASGTVPDVNCVAFSAVRFTPLAAGSVAGKRASGTVPEVSCVAFRAVINVPVPLKLVAVNKPASDMVAELTCMIVPVVPS